MSENRVASAHGWKTLRVALAAYRLSSNGITLLNFMFYDMIVIIKQLGQHLSDARIWVQSLR